MSSRADRFRAAAAIYWALVILLFPLSWIAAMGTAALIHEFGHWIALRCCGKKVYQFRIGITGALLETESLELWQELICSLAGPMAGLLPLLAVKWIPRVALCAMLQSLFNLLPVYPLDGGRCLRCVAGLLRIPEKWCNVLGNMVLIVLTAISAYTMIILRMGIVPLLVVAVLWVKAKRKRPCKRRQHSI